MVVGWKTGMRDSPASATPPARSAACATIHQRVFVPHVRIKTPSRVGVPLMIGPFTGVDAPKRRSPQQRSRRGAPSRLPEGAAIIESSRARRDAKIFGETVPLLSSLVSPKGDPMYDPPSPPGALVDRGRNRLHPVWHRGDPRRHRGRRAKNEQTA